MSTVDIRRVTNQELFS